MKSIFLREGVYFYPEKPPGEQHIYISKEALQAARLDGKEISLSVNHDRNTIVGVASDLQWCTEDDGPTLEVDWDRQLIKQINPDLLSMEEVAVSPEFDAVFTKAAGTFDGKPYEGYLNSMVVTDLSIILDGRPKCPIDRCSLQVRTYANASTTVGTIYTHRGGFRMSDQNNADPPAPGDPPSGDADGQQGSTPPPPAPPPAPPAADPPDGFVAKAAYDKLQAQLAAIAAKEKDALKEKAVALGHDKDALKGKSKDYLTGFISAMEGAKGKKPTTVGEGSALPNPTFGQNETYDPSHLIYDPAEHRKAVEERRNKQANAIYLRGK